MTALTAEILVSGQEAVAADPVLAVARIVFCACLVARQHIRAGRQALALDIADRMLAVGKGSEVPRALSQACRIRALELMIESAQAREASPC